MEEAESRIPNCISLMLEPTPLVISLMLNQYLFQSQKFLTSFKFFLNLKFLSFEATAFKHNLTTVLLYITISKGVDNSLLFASRFRTIF